MGSQKGAGRQQRVYVIEDDEVARGRMVELLERRGYAVTVVPTMEAAITQGFWNGDPARLLFVTRDAGKRQIPLHAPPFS